MNKLSTLIVASALAVLPALGAARADTAENLRIFRDVCLANAPALNDAAIRRAAWLGVTPSSPLFSITSNGAVSLAAHFRPSAWESS